MSPYRWWLSALLLLCALLLGPPARAEEPDAPGRPSGLPADPVRLIESQMENLDVEPIEHFLREVNRTWEGYGPQISLRDFLELYQGGEGAKYAPQAILGGLFRYLVREILANADLLLKLVVLAIVAALLQNLQAAFEAEATGKVAYWVVYIVLMGLAVTGFGLAVATARQVMETLHSFMLAILPTLLTLLISMGGVASAAIFQPVMAALLSVAGTVVTTVVFPLAFLAALLEIASGLNENYKLTNLAGLLRQGAMLTMGLTTTIFMGTVAVKGAAGAVADGVTVKTAKFFVGSFIPVIGKTLSDAADLIMGSSILLKNGLGMLGAAVVFFIVAFPLLKILSLTWVYQIAGALVEPAGAGQIAKMLTTMAKSLQLVFAAVGMVALMFFVSIAVIVGAANMTVMVR
ncbi:MAG: stage III sporulation protein AE [Bacillota bacterium]